MSSRALAVVVVGGLDRGSPNNDYIKILRYLEIDHRNHPSFSWCANC